NSGTNDQVRLAPRYRIWVRRYRIDRCVCAACGLLRRKLAVHKKLKRTKVLVEVCDLRASSLLDYLRVIGAEVERERGGRCYWRQGDRSWADADLSARHICQFFPK